MALSADCIWELQTGGSDTVNGGGFDPSKTAGMFTDGAATVATTSAPVFTSASYNFVAGDVGAWVFIASGTNWTAGWYKIVSVAANAATLNGTIGQAVIGYVNNSVRQLRPSTVVGCAIVASPTSSTWTIDYSQQSAAQFSYTDLASSGTGLTVSSAAKPFAKQQVGNSLVITGGTNFNTGRYVIASVAAGVATVVGPTNITTGVGVSGTGGLGGALASPGQASAAGAAPTFNLIFAKSGTYSITSASTNVAGGCASLPTSSHLYGYNSVRGDLGTAPVFQASGISTATILATTGNGTIVQNVTVDGASLTAIRGISLAGETVAYKLTAKNCTNSGIFGTTVGASSCISCFATGCTTAGAGFNAIGICLLCESFSNTVHGFIMTTLGGAAFCLSYNNSGATSDGFNINGAAVVTNCNSYGNGRDGFRMVSVGQSTVNCLAESNTGLGFNLLSNNQLSINCGTYNNTGGDFANTAGDGSYLFNPIRNTTGTFFVNAAGANFALNSTANQGALARAAGIPGIFPSGTTTGFVDIGAVQHQDPVTGMLFIPNLEST